MLTPMVALLGGTAATLIALSTLVLLMLFAFIYIGYAVMTSSGVNIRESIFAALSILGTTIGNTMDILNTGVVQ